MVADQSDQSVEGALKYALGIDKLSIMLFILLDINIEV